MASFGCDQETLIWGRKTECSGSRTKGVKKQGQWHSGLWRCLFSAGVSACVSSMCKRAMYIAGPATVVDLIAGPGAHDHGNTVDNVIDDIASGAAWLHMLWPSIYP